MIPFVPEFEEADARPSPNFGPRRGTSVPDMIIIHYTGMRNGAAAEDWLCNRLSQVSSHYLVHEDGRVVQMVRECDRAWHAGKSSWKGDADINSRSIGIEVVNPGHELGYRNFPPRQIAAVISLCSDLTARYPIAPESILGHSDVAPGRKIDPGERFPWRQLARSGIGHFVAPVRVGGSPLLGPQNTGKAVEELQSMLSRYGYGVAVTGLFDGPTSAVVRAFQMHFRQRRVDGLADRSTVETLRLLLSKLPG